MQPLQEINQLQQKGLSCPFGTVPNRGAPAKSVHYNDYSQWPSSPKVQSQGPWSHERAS